MISLDLKDSILEQTKTLNNKTRIVSIIKLLLSVLIVSFVICFICYGNYLLYGLLTVISIVVLVIVSIFTKKIYIALKNNKSLEYVYNRHENRRNGSYKTFSPDGKEFIDYNDYKTLDLDILGPKSLYQYICACKTYNGRKYLAKQLTNPDKKNAKFTKLVDNFASNPDALKVEAAINRIDSKNSYNEDEMLSVLNEKININKFGIFCMIASYVLLISGVILFSIYNINWLYLIFFIPLNLFISKYFVKTKIFDINSTQYSLILNDYINVINDIKNINIVDDYYNEIKEKLSADLTEFNKLNSIFDILSYRKNIILSIIGNGLFFLNYIVVFVFNKRIKNIKSN